MERPTKITEIIIRDGRCSVRYSQQAFRNTSRYRWRYFNVLGVGKLERVIKFEYASHMAANNADVTDIQLAA